MHFFFHHLEARNATIDKTEKFILNCLCLVKDPNLLWFAFQPNSLSDMTFEEEKYFHNFEPALQRMKENLMEKGFHLASLGSNMRSTREIVNTRVISEYPHLKNQNYIAPLKSSVVGKLPVLIPLRIMERKMKLDGVLRDVLHPKDENESDKSWVILHDEKFDSQVIQQNLVDLGVTKEIKVYADDKDQKENEKDLRYVVENRSTVLITEDRFFTGCETINILYLCETGSPSMRCSMFRAVETLTVIYLINANNPDCTFPIPNNPMQFEGFCVDDKYF